MRGLRGHCINAKPSHLVCHTTDLIPLSRAVSRQHTKQGVPCRIADELRLYIRLGVNRDACCARRNHQQRRKVGAFLAGQHSQRSIVQRHRLLPCLYDDGLVFAANFNGPTAGDYDDLGGRNRLKTELCAHCRSGDHRRCHDIAVAFCQFFVDHVIDAPAQHKQLDLGHIQNFVQFVHNDVRVPGDLSCLRREEVERGGAACSENLIALAHAERLAVAVGAIGVVGSM